jgi:hypothetical protein
MLYELIFLIRSQTLSKRQITRKKYNMQQQPRLLVPSKLGYARDETHMIQKTETKQGGKQRTIKKPNRKRRNSNKTLNHKKKQKGVNKKKKTDKKQ